MSDTLLQRLVEQNDTLIDLGRTQIEALQDICNKLEGIQTQLIISDCSGEVSSIQSDVQDIKNAVEELKV